MVFAPPFPSDPRQRHTPSPLPMSSLLSLLKTQHQLIAALPLRLRLSYIAVWLLLTLTLLGIAVYLGIKRHHEWFQASALHLKQTMEERLKTSESMIFNLGEGARARGDFGRTAISRYASYMQAHYPFVYMMGYQPIIKTGQRSRYEATQSLLYGKTVTIRDFSNPANPAPGHPDYWRQWPYWSKAATREMYLPLTMAEPYDNYMARYMIGLDLLNSPLLGSTIRQAIHSGKIEVSPPFTLSNGHMGLAYIQAVYAAKSKETPAPAQQEVTGIVLLAITADQLLRHEQLQNTTYLNIRLRRIGSRDQSDDIDSRQNPVDHNKLSNWFLPQFHTRLRIHHAYFPYELEVSETLRLGNLNATIFLLLPAISALLCYLLLLVAATQRRKQHLHDEMSRDLSKEREQAIVTLQAINDAVIVIDQHQTIKYMNPKAAALTRKTLDEVRDHRLSHALQLHYELETEAMLDPVELCLELQQDINLPQHCHLIGNNNQHQYIEGTLSPLTGKHGEKLGVVLAIRDMAPLRARLAASILHREERLKQHANEYAKAARITNMGEMASGMAHEINQPLSAIASYNEAALTLLEDEEPDLALLQRALQGSVQQAQRAGHIIRGLRNLATRQRTALSPVDINQVIRNTLLLASGELAGKHIRLSTHLEPALPHVIADSIQLEQVLFNLVRNAIEAMPATQGHLNIRSHVLNARICVQVQDNGPGIPAEELPNIFTPFFSLKHQGIGLGLTISQSLIESFDGNIYASNHPDGGALFCFELPVIPHAEPQRKAAHEQDYTYDLPG
ncbi:hypothetical protein EGI20_03535 [Aquitalea sp. S1-19]|nr:hypothetical protein [Aquitalea sp. S1-19]